MNQKILIVEDDARTAHWMSVYLERSGYNVILADDGKKGLNLARVEKPDLILLDINLPKLSGIDLCRILRKGNDIPIIMVTSRGNLQDRITGLDEGADDYLTKPFEPDELTARVRALLRRSRGKVRKILSAGPLSLNEETQTVLFEGEDLELSYAQFSLLHTFMLHPDVVFSRNQLIHQALAGDFDSFDRAVDAHIKRLRKAIHRENFKPIQTVYGAGYKFKCH